MTKRQVAMSCKTGSATNIIYGLALGYKSTIVPVFVLAAIIFTSFQLCGTYGACWWTEGEGGGGHI